MSFVPDASLATAWLFEDEETRESKAVLAPLAGAVAGNARSCGCPLHPLTLSFSPTGERGPFA